LPFFETVIYSESQRFVFELIQNADDAAKDTNNEVHFEFLKDCLIVSHNGYPFTQDDIKALTSAGSSTKKADTTKTGYIIFVFITIVSFLQDFLITDKYIIMLPSSCRFSFFK
jgi:hypothetical protein